MQLYVSWVTPTILSGIISICYLTLVFIEILTCFYILLVYCILKYPNGQDVYLTLLFVIHHVSYRKKELLTLRKLFSGVHVAHLFSVFCVMFILLSAFCVLFPMLRISGLALQFSITFIYIIYNCWMYVNMKNNRIKTNNYLTEIVGHFIYVMLPDNWSSESMITTTGRSSVAWDNSWLK